MCAARPRCLAHLHCCIIRHQETLPCGIRVPARARGEGGGTWFRDMLSAPFQQWLAQRAPCSRLRALARELCALACVRLFVPSLSPCLVFIRLTTASPCPQTQVPSGAAGIQWCLVWLLPPPSSRTRSQRTHTPKPTHTPGRPTHAARRTARTAANPYS